MLKAVDTGGVYIKVNDPANGGSTKIYKYSDITGTASRRYEVTVDIT